MIESNDYLNQVVQEQAQVEQELRRKTFHVAGLLYIPLYHLLGPRAAVALGVWTALLGAAELIRLKSPAPSRWPSGFSAGSSGGRRSTGLPRSSTARWACS